MKILSNKEYNLFLEMAKLNKRLTELVEKQNVIIDRQHKLLKKFYGDVIIEPDKLDFPNSTKGGF